MDEVAIRKHLEIPYDGPSAEGTAWVETLKGGPRPVNHFRCRHLFMSDTVEMCFVASAFVLGVPLLVLWLRASDKPRYTGSAPKLFEVIVSAIEDLLDF